MASTPFRVEDAIKAIEEDGFYIIHEPTVGLRISEMERSKSQFSPSSAAGLEFYRDTVLRDTRIRFVLESSFDWCAFGDYRRIQEDRGHIFQLRRGGSKADVLVVQLWKDGSEGVYYRGSHKIPPEILNSIRAANRMFEVAGARLERAGCPGIPVDFRTGGFIIMDARLAFETDHGSPVTCSYTTKDQLKGWPKLIPPKNSTKLVEELQTERVGAYFEQEGNG